MNQTPVRRRKDAFGSVSSSVTVPSAAVSIQMILRLPFASVRSSSRHAFWSSCGSMYLTTCEAIASLSHSTPISPSWRADDSAFAIQQLALNYSKKSIRTARRLERPVLPAP